uniref:Uncharacterized protein n=1 Tax=Sphaerodactylus townsendi TaxID=933632 RepID=A0ACB8ENS0_9SAUR
MRSEEAAAPAAPGQAGSPHAGTAPPPREGSAQAERATGAGTNHGHAAPGPPGVPGGMPFPPGAEIRPQ